MRASTALKVFSFACLILILLVYVVPLYALFQDLNDGKFYFGISNVKVTPVGKKYLVNVTLTVKDTGSTVLSNVVIYAVFNVSGKIEKVTFNIGEIRPVMIRNYTQSMYLENVTSMKFVELVINMKIGGLLPVVMKFAKPAKSPS